MSTLSELITQYNEAATAAGQPTRKGFSSKAQAEAALAALTVKPAKKAKVATSKVAKVAKEKTESSGFKFGPVWMNSITAGSGIALRPANREKLIATAAAHGVKVTVKAEAAEICAAIAAAV